MSLVLTRKYGETVLIGNDIKITVLESKGRQVQLVFDAPKEVVILRGELAERQTEADRKAS